MKIVEFQIPLPISVEDFNRCSLYLLSRASIREMEGGSGFKIVRNEECIKDGIIGRYTEKRFHLARNLPSWLRAVLGEKFTILTEKSWNTYPLTFTEYCNEALSSLEFSIRSNHIDGLSITENAMDLSDSDLCRRRVILIDLTDFRKFKSYDFTFDVTLARSETLDLLPLKKGWHLEAERTGMVCHKLIRINIPYFGILASKIENFVVNVLQDKLILYLSSALCWIDLWYDLPLESLRKMEDECYNMLNANFEENFGMGERIRSTVESERKSSAVACNGVSDSGVNASFCGFQGPVPIPPVEATLCDTFRDAEDSEEFADALEDFEDYVPVEPVEIAQKPKIDTVRSTPTTFAGYLFKLGGFFSCSWNIRYIIISGLSLYYFDNRNDLKPKATISLKDARISWIGEYMNRAYVFSVTTKNKRIYYWSADTESSVKRWVILLQILCECSPDFIIQDLATDWLCFLTDPETDIDKDPAKITGVIHGI